MIKIGKTASNISVYSYEPDTKKELRDIIKQRISKEGPNCNLNDIGVSLIDNMNGLFHRSKFNNDISRWDISRAFSTSLMFAETSFNQDISNWIIPVNCNVHRMFRCSQIKEEFKSKSLQKK